MVRAEGNGASLRTARPRLVGTRSCPLSATRDALLDRAPSRGIEARCSGLHTLLRDAYRYARVPIRQRLRVQDGAAGPGRRRTSAPQACRRCLPAEALARAASRLG